MLLEARGGLFDQGSAAGAKGRMAIPLKRNAKNDLLFKDKKQP